MNSKVYKWCAVPECTNTSIKTPDKIFAFVPQKKKIRDKWLKLARRDSTALLANSHLYFCEDHFDMPNDMENYMEYHIMGSVSQVRMKPGCLPTRYECQSHVRKRTSDAKERSCTLKKLKMALIEECKVLEKRTAAIKQVELGETSAGSSVSQAYTYIDHIPQEDAHETADKLSRSCSENSDTECDEYEEVNYAQTGDSNHIVLKTEIDIEEEQSVPNAPSNEQSTWTRPNISPEAIRVTAGPNQTHLESNSKDNQLNEIKEEPIDELEIFENLESNSKDIQSNDIKEEPTDEFEIFENLESNSKDIQSNEIKKEPADELEIFGKYVVEQLNSLEEDAVLAQEEIREVLAKYQLRRRRKHEAIIEASQLEESQMIEDPLKESVVKVTYFVKM